jgi:DME family drug/metabolite transporter
MTTAPRSLTRGYLIGLAATVSLSFTGILISHLSRAYQLPSLVLAFWRDCIVVLVGCDIALVSRRRFRPCGWRIFILYGLSLALFNTMWTFSVEFNGAAVATVLAFSSPAMTAILAHYLLGENQHVKKISILLSLAALSGQRGSGCSGLAGQRHRNHFGLLTGFFFACYNMVGKTSANRSIDLWTTMLFGFTSAVVVLFIFNVALNVFSGNSPLTNFMWLGTSVSGWGILILLGLGPTIGGFGLYLVSLGYLPATVANLIGALEPVFTAVWAYFIFSELFTEAQLIGSLVLLGSVVLLRVGDRRGPEPVPA